jgi:hypothetical protein
VELAFARAGAHNLQNIQALKFDCALLSVVHLKNQLPLETNMPCSDSVGRSRERPLIVNDLCAQLIPLNRYGLPGFGAVVADGARALIGVSRSALSAVVARHTVGAPNEAH